MMSGRKHDSEDDLDKQIQKYLAMDERKQEWGMFADSKSSKQCKHRCFSFRRN